MNRKQLGAHRHHVGKESHALLQTLRFERLAACWNAVKPDDHVQAGRQNSREEAQDFRVTADPSNPQCTHQSTGSGSVSAVHTRTSAVRLGHCPLMHQSSCTGSLSAAHTRTKAVELGHLCDARFVLTAEPTLLGSGLWIARASSATAGSALSGRAALLIQDPYRACTAATSSRWHFQAGHARAFVGAIIQALQQHSVCSSGQECELHQALAGIHAGGASRSLQSRDITITGLSRNAEVSALAMVQTTASHTGGSWGVRYAGHEAVEENGRRVKASRSMADNLQVSNSSVSVLFLN
eukprot:892696-Pelagomonas_calceolata.AAC.6